MHDLSATQVSDAIGPAVAALFFIVIMSLMKEPARRRYNAILVAGASSAYMSGGFGVWELPYIALAGGVVAYAGLRSHRWIGLAWLMHAAWDVLHHLYGNPIWPFMPMSSFGCAIFDVVIAWWFLVGAPSPFVWIARRTKSTAGVRSAGDTGVP